jgi:hypothetical protein
VLSSEIPGRKEIKYRGSSIITTITIGLLVITPMVLLGLLSVLTGSFIIPALFFLLFLAGCAFVLMYGAVAEVSLNTEGVSQKTLFSRWRFRWQEIENWALLICPNNSDVILFKAGSPAQKLQISSAAVNEKELLAVKGWFQEFVGNAMEYDTFIGQFEKSKQ